MAAAADGAAAGSGGGASAAGRQIEAFTVQPVLNEKRVLCLEAWSSYLLIGLAGGLWLRAGRPAPPSHRWQAPRSSWQATASLKTWLLPPFSPHHVAPQMAPCYSPPSGPPAAAVPTVAMPPQAQQAAAVARSRGSGSGQWCSRCAALPAGG